jgi:hypothetical protein
MESYQLPGMFDPALPVEMLYLHRMRSQEDREALAVCFEKIFKRPLVVDAQPSIHVSPDVLQIGRSVLRRTSNFEAPELPSLVSDLLRPMEVIMKVL